MLHLNLIFLEEMQLDRETEEIFFVMGKCKLFTIVV